MEPSQPFLPYRNTGEQVVKYFASNTQRGLSYSEVQKRRTRYGENIIEKRKPRAVWQIIFSNAKNILFLLLIAAAIISFAIQEYLDAIIITVAAIIDIIIGTVQEYRAEKEFQSIQKVQETHAVVIRNGRQQQISTSEIVPGDILQIQEGQIIPADARIIEAYHIQINEAILTGEQQAQEKNEARINKETVIGDRANMLFMGTSVMTGSGKAVVTATAANTEFGKIAESIRDVKDTKTPLQLKIQRFVRWIGVIAISIITVVIAVGFLTNQPIQEIFTMAVSLAVSAVPEGLTTGFFILLAIGMRRMLKKRALTQKLIAAETLGSVNILCVDKTGTMTEGRMEVSGIFTPSGEQTILQQEWKKKLSKEAEKEIKHVMEIATLASDAFCHEGDTPSRQWECVGDETEQAIIRGFGHFQTAREVLQKQYPRIDTIPFNAKEKYMATLHQHALNNEEHIIAVKGAPEIILKQSTTLYTSTGNAPMNNTIIEKWLEKTEEYSKKGQRILAVATRQINPSTKEIDHKHIDNLTFLGLIALKDPIRKGAKATIQEASSAGVKTVIVTGDHKYIAMKIANDLNIKTTPSSVIDGEEMNKLTNNQLKTRINDINIFARIAPNDKMRIVKILKEKGNVVAMTGDGVNDAPALQAADIGIAVEAGSDTAKETAEIILLDNNIKTIIDAIREGRRIFDNIKKIIVYLISDSFSEIILIITALMLRLPLPLIAAQILWINIVSDGIIDLALATEPAQKDIMKIPPKKQDTSIINTEGKIIIATVTVISVLASIIIFWWALSSTGNLQYARTMTFSVLAIDSIFYVLSIRVARHSIFSNNPLKNKWLIGAILLTLLLQIATIYVPALNRILKTQPLALRDWIIIATVAIVTILGIEIAKAFSRSLENTKKQSERNTQ